MIEEKRKRPIELPVRLWDALKEAARRERRSSQKQLQVILEAHLGLGESESHSPSFSAASDLTEGEQKYLFSTGKQEPVSSGRESRKQKLDLEDVRQDARIRSQRKREQSRA
jgi:hypothetical protein